MPASKAITETVDLEFASMAFPFFEICWVKCSAGWSIRICTPRRRPRSGCLASLPCQERHQVGEFDFGETLVIVGGHQWRLGRDRLDLRAVQEMKLIVIAHQLQRVAVLVQQHTIDSAPVG